MGTTTNGVYEGGPRARRKTALETLQQQLKRGTKPNKGPNSGSTKTPNIPLTDKDIARIKKEIENLKAKL